MDLMYSIFIYFSFFDEASEVRAVDPDYAQGHTVMFADLFPFLLASQVRQVEKLPFLFAVRRGGIGIIYMCYLLQGSINAFNEYLKESISINRFRPKYLSFHVSLLVLFTEIRKISIASAKIRYVATCVILNMNCETYRLLEY